MKIPTPIELHPRLTELESKRNTLHIERTAKVAEAAIIRARIQKSPSNGNVAENRVRVILGESPLPDSAPDMTRLEQLLLELNDLNRAIGILDGAIQKEKTVASRLVLNAVKPHVTILGTTFAKAFLDLHAAHLDYNKYIDAVENVGVSVSGLRVCPNGVGFPTDLSGQYSYGIRDFIDAGFLQTSDMPKVLRP
jgi:hypothetical protein